MKNAYKKNVVISLAVAIGIFVVLPAVFVFMADPCHIFHRPLPGILSHGFTGNARCQDAGLINTYLNDKKENFDSIFIGTSLSGNFRPEYIAEKTRWQRTLKLTLPGSQAGEQQMLVYRALASENVRHVFWEIFPQQFHLSSPAGMDKLIKTNQLPAYLYNNSRIDDYRYIFNLTTLSGAIDILNKTDYYNINPIERVDFWDNGCTKESTCPPFHRENDIEELNVNYTPAHQTAITKDDISSIDFSSADHYLLKTVLPLCNSDISFDLFFPPVSMLWFSKQDANAFNYQLYMLRYVVEKTRHCSNIRVFAFNNELWITGDLAHYHDPRHFYGGVHDYIIDSMATGKHLITMDNVEAFERLFIENVNNYAPWASTEEQLRNSIH